MNNYFCLVHIVQGKQKDFWGFSEKRACSEGYIQEGESCKGKP